MDYFSNKRVWITGGSSGIGLATARLLRQRNAHLVLVARDPQRLEQAEAELATIHGHGTIETISVDIADYDALDRICSSQGVDVLINNAGVVMPGAFLELPLSEFDSMLRTNLMGGVYLTRLILPEMIARGAGHVAFVSSLVGLMGIYGYTAYAASKFAIRGFAEALRCELRPHGIRVSVCYPPDTDTPQLAFDNRYKPAETRAIAGNVRPLRAEVVAARLLRGMAAGRFHIVPGAGARFADLAYRFFPTMVRTMFDSDIRKARAGAGIG